MPPKGSFSRPISRNGLYWVLWLLNTMKSIAIEMRIFSLLFSSFLDPAETQSTALPAFFGFFSTFRTHIFGKYDNCSAGDLIVHGQSFLIPEDLPET